MGAATFAERTNTNLKNVYTKEVLESLENNATVLWGKIGTSPLKATGNGIFGAKIANGNQSGIKSQNEGESLASADYQNVKQYKVNAKILTDTFEVTGLQVALAQGDASAFATELMLEMDGVQRDSAKELNQQLYRNGSGLIARVNGAVSASTSVVFDGGISRHFRIGMPIDTYDSSTNLVKQCAGIKIADINLSTNTLTLESAITTDDNAYIYRKSVHDNAPTDGKELAGLPRITDDGTDFASFEGIVRSGTGYVSAWKGLEIAMSGATLSDDLLQRMKAQVLNYSNSSVDTLVMSTSQQRKYLSITLPQVQYSEKDKRDSSGPAVLSWNGCNVLIDTDCGDDEIYMFDMKRLKKYIVRPLGFDNDFGPTVKWNNGYDKGIGYTKFYGNIGTDMPKAFIRATGLAVATF